MRRLAVCSTLPLLLALAGCDMLGIESASTVAARKEAEGKAVGGACRHAGRAIEDCFALNRKSDKAAVFAGWREMNDYMRENKIESVAPQAEADEAPERKSAKAPADEAAAPEKKAARPGAGQANGKAS